MYVPANKKQNTFHCDYILLVLSFSKKIKGWEVRTIVRRGYMTIGGKTLKRVLQMRQAGLKKNVLKIAWKTHKSSIYEHRSYCFSIHSETTTNALLLSVSHEKSVLCCNSWLAVENSTISIHLYFLILFNIIDMLWWSTF